MMHGPGAQDMMRHMMRRMMHRRPGDRHVPRAARHGHARPLCAPALRVGRAYAGPIRLSRDIWAQGHMPARLAGRACDTAPALPPKEL